MKRIQILDCTLRDGGYCNNCHFGYENIRKITSGLVEANIDIIECGFYEDKIVYNSDFTRFSDVLQVMNVVPNKQTDKIFVLLADQGKFNASQLPDCDGTTIDGLRIAFHKKNRKEGLNDCKIVQQKGYKVFVQAMVSISYSDEEFLDLIKNVNELEPYAFYIVDSFGMMKQKELARLFYMVEHNLKETIRIGFHSHNNLQLAYSNAQSLVNIQTKRDLIIDSSVYGMGRGAGNLNTELFVEYLNENVEGDYRLKPLLVIIDEILSHFYHKNPWGYSLPNYLSAVHNAHPNYAGYLDDKKTLTVKAMNEIFSLMDAEKALSYDEDYIENLYIQYMGGEYNGINRKEELESRLNGKKILMIAPGKSSQLESDRIVDFAANEDVITVSINFVYDKINTDFIFISNLRRYSKLDKSAYSKCIVTSQIPAEEMYMKTPYHELLNNKENVKDNAGLMAIRLFMNCGVKELYLAGFDGYSHDAKENYLDGTMDFATKSVVLDNINRGMEQVLNEYGKEVDIEFVTTSRYAINKPL